jgi:hypothetical protein
VDERSLWLKLGGSAFVGSLVGGIAAAIPFWILLILGFGLGGGQLGIFLLDEGQDPNMAVFLPFLIAAIVSAVIVYTWINKVLFSAIGRWVIGFWPLLGALTLASIVSFVLSGFGSIFLGYDTALTLLRLIGYVIYLAFLSFLVAHWGRPQVAVSAAPSLGFCTRCGTPRALHASFCGSCGQQFTS